MHYFLSLEISHYATPACQEECDISPSSVTGNEVIRKERKACLHGAPESMSRLVASLNETDVQNPPEQQPCIQCWVYLSAISEKINPSIVLKIWTFCPPIWQLWKTVFCDDVSLCHILIPFIGYHSVLTLSCPLMLSARVGFAFRKLVTILTFYVDLSPWCMEFSDR